MEPLYNCLYDQASVLSRSGFFVIMVHFFKKRARLVDPYSFFLNQVD